jgi:rare lipoprotein A
LLATLRTGEPAQSQTTVRVGSARPYVPEISSSDGRIRGEVPMPEGRPYSLGNTSADYASVNATSEMSASSRRRGHPTENARAVAYDNGLNDAAATMAYRPVDPRGPSEVLSGRGLY